MPSSRDNFFYLHAKNILSQEADFHELIRWGTSPLIESPKGTISGSACTKHTTWPKLANDHKGPLVNYNLWESRRDWDAFHLPKIHGAHNALPSQLDTHTLLELWTSPAPPLYRISVPYQHLFFRPTPLHDKLTQNTPAFERHRSSLIRPRRACFFFLLIRHDSQTYLSHKVRK